MGKSSKSAPPPPPPAPVMTPVANKTADQPIQRVANTQEVQDRVATAQPTTLLTGTPEDEALKRQQQAGVLIG